MAWALLVIFVKIQSALQSNKAGNLQPKDVWLQKNEQELKEADCFAPES